MSVDTQGTEPKTLTRVYCTRQGRAAILDSRKDFGRTTSKILSLLFSESGRVPLIDVIGVGAHYVHLVPLRRRACGAYKYVVPPSSVVVQVRESIKADDTNGEESRLSKPRDSRVEMCT